MGTLKIRHTQIDLQAEDPGTSEAWGVLEDLPLDNGVLHVNAPFCHDFFEAKPPLAWEIGARFGNG